MSGARRHAWPRVFALSHHWRVDDREAAAAFEDEGQRPDHTVISDRFPAGVWVVDPRSSQVNFRARTMFGLLPVNGFFETFSGTLTVDERGAAQGTLSVRTATIQTGIDHRDQQLRSAQIFDAQAHAEMTFTLETVTAARHDPFERTDHLRLGGTLTVRAHELPLSFPATVISHDDHLHIEARVMVDHEAAGLGWRRPGVIGRRVRADVALTLRPS